MKRVKVLRGSRGASLEWRGRRRWDRRRERVVIVCVRGGGGGMDRWGRKGVVEGGEVKS